MEVCVLWDDGSESWEPLLLMATTDPVTLARYAKYNDLLETPGWKRFKRIAKRKKKYIWMVRQARAAHVCHAKANKFGIRVPRTYREACEIDNECGNRLWQEAIDKEMEQIMEYKVFRDHGKNIHAPAGYKQRFVCIWSSM